MVPKSMPKSLEQENNEDEHKSSYTYLKIQEMKYYILLVRIVLTIVDPMYQHNIFRTKLTKTTCKK